MDTIFSHIVQKRLSRENENVATEALAFVLRSSEAARGGMMKLLRGIAPDLPPLHFRTQQSEGGARPDMCGMDGQDVRVLIENKFWAGLTDSQPVQYVRSLAPRPAPSILLMVVPAARRETVWREVARRLSEAEISAGEHPSSGGARRALTTSLGPLLALTTWDDVLTAIEGELSEEPQALSDVRQLRALCEAADRDAFTPFTAEELTDQRTPALLLKLGRIIQDAVTAASADGFVAVEGLRPTASWDRMGRYVWMGARGNVGAWFGTALHLWARHGGTPFWLEFQPGDFGKAPEVRTRLEPWASRRGIFTAMDGDRFVLAVDLPTGEEEDHVVRAVAAMLAEISRELKGLHGQPVAGILETADAANKEAPIAATPENDA